MKIGSFIAHTLIFVAAWIGSTIYFWAAAREASQTWLTPWLLPLFNHMPPDVTPTIGAVVAVCGSLIAALTLLAVLIAVEALAHYLFRGRSGLSS